MTAKAFVWQFLSRVAASGTAALYAIQTASCNLHLNGGVGELRLVRSQVCGARKSGFTWSVTQIPLTTFFWPNRNKMQPVAWFPLPRQDLGRPLKLRRSKSRSLQLAIVPAVVQCDKSTQSCVRLAERTSMPQAIAHPVWKTTTPTLKTGPWSNKPCTLLCVNF